MMNSDDTKPGDTTPDDVSAEEMDAIQTPLVDDVTPLVNDTRSDSVVAALPEGFQVTRNEPDKETHDLIADMEARTLCGSPLTFTWNQGPWKGKATRMYCAEPFCVQTGRCTGPMFVPSDPQYTTADPMNPFRQRRDMVAEEVIAAARWCARKATGKDDPRSDREIARFAGEVLKRMRAALRGAGDWRA